MKNFTRFQATSTQSQSNEIRLSIVVVVGGGGRFALMEKLPARPSEQTSRRADSLLRPNRVAQRRPGTAFPGACYVATVTFLSLLGAAEDIAEEIGSSSHERSNATEGGTEGRRSRKFTARERTNEAASGLWIESCSIERSSASCSLTVATAPEADRQVGRSWWW